MKAVAMMMAMISTAAMASGPTKPVKNEQKIDALMDVLKLHTHYMEENRKRTETLAEMALKQNGSTGTNQQAILEIQRRIEEKAKMDKLVQDALTSVIYDLAEMKNKIEQLQKQCGGQE